MSEMIQRITIGGLMLGLALMSMRAIGQPLTQGKERITVRFQAHPGHTAGRVFGCRTLRDEVQ